ncbi:MAG: phospholipase D-like domain-containing protein [Bacillota bacterium]
MLKILNAPFYEEFFSLVEASKDQIKLCSPFIKSEIVDEIYKTVNDNCVISVVTNVNLMSLYKRSSDVNALNTILQNGGAVFNYQKLHAKIYVFDDKKAIITSANLTSSGLKRNFEYGILIDELTLVSSICEDYSRLCHSELSGKLKIEHINEIQNIINSIPKPPDLSLPKLHLDYEEFQDDYFDKDVSNIIKNLSGWKKAVFSALKFIEKQVFTTSDFSLIVPYLQNKYPANNNIEAKIRQQLQELRDLGLVKFEGNGVYKKLWI